jgi:CelD/BcsL family acetyltransferase involved in cellulose biosynthesis
VIGADAFVETTTVEGLSRVQPEWRDLASRATEPNVFAGSEFLLPALRLAGAGCPTILLAWPDASRARLIGVLALRLPPIGQGLARVWRSEQAGLAAAMFDADLIAPALEATLAWLRARRGVAGLLLPAVEPGGAMARAVRALAVGAALPLEEINQRRRAALVVGGAGFEAALEKKRRKEWARQQRRLAERGCLQTRLAEDSDAVERFLTLEAKGWKGARGTALAADPRRFGFARAMLGAFAEQGRLQIHELALDSSAIAMGIVLRDGARAFYWKTAYDEALGEFSPGVQLTLALSRRLEREPGLELVDSCALQDHPMIDRIWPGRIDLVDFAVAVAPERGWRLRAWLAAERAAAGQRERVKRLANRLRGRKIS